MSMIKNTLAAAALACLSLAASAGEVRDKAYFNGASAAATVHFQSSSFDLGRSSRETLDALATAIRSNAAAGHPVANIALYGFADPIGAHVRNDFLASDRAVTVGAYLGKALDTTAFTVDSMADAYPVTGCSKADKVAWSGKCLALDRRVEIIVSFR